MPLEFKSGQALSDAQLVLFKERAYLDEELERPFGGRYARRRFQGLQSSTKTFDADFHTALWWVLKCRATLFPWRTDMIRESENAEPFANKTKLCAKTTIGSVVSAVSSVTEIGLLNHLVVVMDTLFAACMHHMRKQKQAANTWVNPKTSGRWDRISPMSHDFLQIFGFTDKLAETFFTEETLGQKWIPYLL